MRIAVLTTGRQDWSYLRPLVRALEADPCLSPYVVVGGMACSQLYGQMVERVRDQVANPIREIRWDVRRSPDIQAGRCLSLTGRLLASLRPNAFLILGDRFETLAAAMAAVLQKIPIIHLYGGEETEGAFDNSFRHAITKLSHLHFVSHEEYAQRILQMGEDPASVHVVGLLSIDGIRALELPSRKELESHLGRRLVPPIGLVTLQPLTAGRSGDDELQAVLHVLDTTPCTWVVTLPNNDPGHRLIRRAFKKCAAKNSRISVHAALGIEGYFGLLKIAEFVLGNSSSGVVEAPSLRVPSINVGDRQKGRIKSPSVVDVPPDPQRIREAIDMATSKSFRAQVLAMPLPFGEGHAADTIAGILRTWQPPSTLGKRFHTKIASGT